jgi:hypothetical protein
MVAAGFAVGGFGDARRRRPGDATCREDDTPRRPRPRRRPPVMSRSPNGPRGATRTSVWTVMAARPRSPNRQDLPACRPSSLLMDTAPTHARPERHPRPPARTHVTEAAPSCSGTRGIYIFDECVSIGTGPCVGVPGSTPTPAASGPRPDSFPSAEAPATVTRRRLRPPSETERTEAPPRDASSTEQPVPPTARAIEGGRSGYMLL